MIRICWRSKLTGYQGYGEWHPMECRAVFQKWIDNMAREWSMIEHWIEVLPRCDALNKRFKFK